MTRGNKISTKSKMAAAAATFNSEKLLVISQTNLCSHKLVERRCNVKVKHISDIREYAAKKIKASTSQIFKTFLHLLIIPP